jgi:hypothetical protein
MFPEDRLDERTPAYLDGYYGAEADHEDGAKPYAMWVNARLKLYCDELTYAERQRLLGRSAYAREAIRGRAR